MMIFARQLVVTHFSIFPIAILHRLRCLCVMMKLRVFPSCSTNVIVIEYVNVSVQEHILMQQHYSSRMVHIPWSRQFIRC